MKLSPKLSQEKYLINNQPFDRIVATARVDNIASCKILEKLGFSYKEKIEKFGAFRNSYEYKVPELRLETPWGETNSNQNNWYQFFPGEVCGHLESDPVQETWNTLKNNI